MEAVKTRPKVSVIIPVYNGEKYIKQCLKSVIRQTLKDIEIIIVDDGSTDKTPSILRSFAKKDKRIRVFTQQNGGGGAARNTGLKYATGEYLSILDADDFFETNMLELSYNKVKETNSDIVVFRSDNYIEESGKVSLMPWTIRTELLPDTQPFTGEDIKQDVFSLFTWWSWDKLFRTDYIKENEFYFQEQRTTNDLLFVFCAFIKAGSVVTMNDILAHHRRAAGSLSNTREKSWHCFYDALIAVRDFLKSENLYSRFEDDFINYASSFSLWHLNTLLMPQKELLFNKLHSEYFKELGVEGYPLSKFYNKQNFYDCERILQGNEPIKNAENIKVSVVMPSLNVAAYIRECMESVINQTLNEIEIICVDAGSTDGTLEILEEYQKKDSRITILHSPVKSYGYQMNMGMDAAKGEYLAIVETDDYIKPNMYEELYKLAEDNYLDIIKSDHCLFVTDDKGEKHFSYRPMIGNLDICKYGVAYAPAENLGLFKFGVNIWTSLYNMSFLRTNNIRFNESLGAAYQDNGFWLLTMALARRLMYHNKAYYMLRRDNPNSSIHSKEKVFCICDEYDYIRNEIFKRPELAKTFLPICAYRRFTNYEGTYERVADEYKEMFLERFASDFKKLMDAGELQGEYFDMKISVRLRMLLDDPKAYKYHRLFVENSTNTYFNIEELNRVRHELDCAYGSLSFRVGRMMTWPLRKLRDVARRAKRISYEGFEKAFRENDNDSKKEYEFYNNLSRDFYPAELENWYFNKTKMILQLDYPKTFNEKLQWLKLYDITSKKAMLSDSAKAKEYAAEKIGEEYVKPQLGIWKSFNEIDFDSLPDSFLLRATHGCDESIIVRNKNDMDKEELREGVNKWLSHNYAFVNGFELQYMNIEPRIIAEPYADDDKQLQCEVLCFEGRMQLIICKNMLFDMEGKSLGKAYKDEAACEDVTITRDNIERLKDLAEKLSKGLSFVRADFTINGESIIFDKLIFTPYSGIKEWDNEEMDLRLGDMLRLPIRYPIPKYTRYDRIKKEILQASSQI